MAKILIIGCGNIGGALANKLAVEGHDVTGLKREPPTEKTVVTYIKADVTEQKSLKGIALNFDQVIYILAPSGKGLGGYKAAFETGVNNVLNAFQDNHPTAEFTFVSSSRVYGQNQGEWVNEESETKPIEERGKILLAAENKFLGFNSKTTIIRFSGIYGRTDYFLNQLKEGAAIQKEPPYYTNRIHRDDCVRALAFLINKKSKGNKLCPIYLTTDHDPAPKWEVANFLTQIHKLSKPTAFAVEKNVSSNKRLENKKLIKEGFAFKFKSYKDGYTND